MATSQNTDLVEITGLANGYFCRKEFLSVNEIYSSLEGRSLNQSGEKMKGNIQKIFSDLFLNLPVEFPITGLQHATTLESMEKIIGSRSFTGGKSQRAEFQNFSFWAADISSIDIEQAQQDVETYIQGKVPQSSEYRENMRKQFANSPAFNKSASRYGNFRFSFELSYLLSLYGSQFCSGEKPQMSILGTDTYKQEIAHYIVVHSPHTKCFKDLPMVPSLQTRCGPLPYVYWMGDTLYWKPESTLQELHLLTRKNGVIRCPLYQMECFAENCDHKISCVWNQLVFALHIPPGKALQFPVQTLTDNLSACEVVDPYMKPNSTRMNKTTADSCINRVKQRLREEAQDPRCME